MAAAAVNGLMLVGTQAAEQAVLLVVRAGGEINRVGPSSIAAVANLEGPQPVDDDRLALGVAHLAQRLPAAKIEGVDIAVAEISDPQGAGQVTEISRRDCHTPGRVELTMVSKSPGDCTIEIESIHDAMALARYIVVLCGVLHRKGHKKFAADESDVERGIGIRQIWIGKEVHT